MSKKEVELSPRKDGYSEKEKARILQNIKLFAEAYLTVNQFNLVNSQYAKAQGRAVPLLEIPDRLVPAGLNIVAPVVQEIPVAPQNNTQEEVKDDVAKSTNP